jgi:hypothetical protein
VGGWVDGWMDGWMDGWAGQGQAGGRTDTHGSLLCIKITHFIQRIYKKVPPESSK